MTPPAAPTSDDLAHQRTSLAFDRTRLAHERTLMAWVRTAISLISFGFTIYKFFQGLSDAKQISVSQRLIGPRGFALTMIALGVGALVLATIQHRNEMNALAAEYDRHPTIPRSTAQVLASVVGALGIAALVVVLMHA
jgi:putative membrane protein